MMSPSVGNVTNASSMGLLVKHLAVEVGHHDLNCADFEGIISEGEYGSGPVLVWDTGWFEPILENKVTAGAMLRTGLLDFVLHGHRLKGRFSLVKIKGKTREWLLIKRHDSEARPGYDITEEYQTSVLTGRTLADLETEAKTGKLRIHRCG